MPGGNLVGKKSKSYLWESVIGLGFLSGLWTTVGINPEQVVYTAVTNAIEKSYPDPLLRTLFIVLPTILLLVSIWGAYRNGKELGLVSVILAYCAGLLIFSATGIAIILLVAALISGWVATDRRLAKKLSHK